MTPDPRDTDPLRVAEDEAERRDGLITRLSHWLSGGIQPFCSKCGCPMEERWTREAGRGERYDPKTGAGVQPERLSWSCANDADDADTDTFRHDFWWLPRRRDRPVSGRCPR